MRTNVIYAIGFLVLLVLGISIGYGVQYFLSSNSPRSSVQLDPYGFSLGSETSTPSQQQADQPLQPPLEVNRLPVFTPNAAAVAWEDVQTPFFSSDLCFLDTAETCIPIFLEWTPEYIVLQNTRREAAEHTWYRWLYGRVAAQTNSGLYQFYLPYSEVVRPEGHANQLADSHKFIFNTALTHGLNPIWLYTIVDAAYSVAQEEEADLGQPNELTTFPVYDFAQSYRKYRQNGVSAQQRTQLPDEIATSPEAAALAVALAEQVSPVLVEGILADAGALESKYLAVAGNNMTRISTTYTTNALDQSMFYNSERDGSNQWLHCRNTQAYVCSLEVEGSVQCQPLTFLSDWCSRYFLNL
ncbi:hypothetical protein LRY65_03590 [Candidatus Woesebacteria bacterium]|nr:hypothetical protein [Candidatus Woesebacteria bacterium]MCD8506975.1 hypothetical protein [Candidatus Woesebacteria bacterium]MCD8527266.1 hypothetical protein [Candidatus Woesebacteria bacterium]MCD8546632.1 hypothetical protein [Candidatus Woesebacteria bacterium]